MNSPKVSEKAIKPFHTAKSIGILGGTFDPIHNGHIIPLLSSAQKLSLTQVFLMPTHIPPHKSTVIATPKQRAAMVELACKDHHYLALDQRELNRKSTTYTVDTLREIRTENSADTTIYFFIGMDSLLNFSQWKHHAEILSLCNLIVNTRPGFCLTSADETTQAIITQHQVTSVEQLQQHHCGGIYFAPPCHEDISSTQIRQLIKQGHNSKNFMPKSVFDYIQQQQLYLR